ncbi:MAG: hypothetical protein ACI8QD_000538 [Cyclobacteriaceae bacterium]|jgi:hypothetical protein
MKYLHFTITLGYLCFTACQSPKQSEPAPTNSAAEGFNIEASDEQAITIADEVMVAMGGRANWDAANFIRWDFFGSRSLIWDKASDVVRVKSLRSDLDIIVDFSSDSLTGRVWKDGQEFSDTDSLSFYLERGRRMWINDSYWLVMPFKLKDSGVTLSFLGEDTTATGIVANKLRLTFEKVGVTPENAYEIWVSKADSLVNQWAYYREGIDQDRGFVMPWLDYQTYGNIRLSGDRGGRTLSNIKVLEAVPLGVFDSFEISF